MHRDAATADARGLAALPVLRELLVEAVVLTERMLARVPLQGGDHMAFMGTFFLAKQTEHAHGVLALAGPPRGAPPGAPVSGRGERARGAHPDAGLTARSMVEGLWQLAWVAGALDEPEAARQDRAYRWIAFTRVRAWRHARARLAEANAGTPAGRTPVAARRAELEAALAAAAAELEPDRHLFLTSKARARVADGKPEPGDPYVKHWTGLTVYELAEAARDLGRYHDEYARFCDRHHWDPVGVAVGVRVNGRTLSYDGRTPTAGAAALDAALHCLVWTAGMVGAHAGLGGDAQLDALEARRAALDARVRGLHPDAGPPLPPSPEA